MKFAASPSPNFTERRDGKTVKYLILHYTDTETAEEALHLLRAPAHQASAHYMADEDGTIHRIVDENMRAWHAGKSYWEGEEDINSSSIGIEIQNPGHSFGLRPFPPVQMEAVLELCQGIIQRHNIKPHHVLAHSDIAPGRKIDPGPLFPWQWLAKNGIGLWPQITPADERGENDLKKILTAYGYDPRIDLPVLEEAFHLHWGKENTVQMARALLRMKNAA